MSIVTGNGIGRGRARDTGRHTNMVLVLCRSHRLRIVKSYAMHRLGQGTAR